MQDQRKVDSLFELCQALKIQLGDSLVMAVGVADGHCQCVDVSICRKGSGLFNIRILGDFIPLGSFLTADGAQLCFDRSTGCACQNSHLIGLVDIFLQGIVGSVKHDGGKSISQSFLCFSGSETVIQMHRDLYLRIPGSLDHQRSDHIQRSMF